MKTLPYRLDTATGDRFDFTFPLHEQTASPMRVAQLLSAILEVIDRDLAVVGDAGNGDVLQALAMALAARARMVHAPAETVEPLTAELLRTALTAARQAERQSPESGRA